MCVCAGHDPERSNLDMMMMRQGLVEGSMCSQP